MSNNSTASELDRLIGLSGAKRIVTSFFRSETDTHAILFYGPEGCGKDELATIVANYWLCLNPEVVQGADGSCRACGALTRGTNPDLLRISPIGAGNQIVLKQFEEKGSPDEAIVPLSIFLRTPPLLSRHKVVIISDAERMNEAASNTLLKTLEEPPPFTKMILTTSSTGGIRSTILSRVLAAACSLPTSSELVQAFPQATPEDILVSESAPGRLAKILAHPKSYRELVRFARSLVERSRGEALVASEELRSIAEKLESSLKCGMRSSYAECLRTLCIVFAREPGFPPNWAEATIVAHDRILANGNAGLVIDALFAKCLIDQRL